MVKRAFAHSKSAFTMIELIFAIVIIAISVISLPMMNQAVSKGMEGNLLQEAIFAASAELNQVISYHWDENSTQLNDSLSKVVWSSPNDCNTSTKRRDGHINQPLHRRCLDDNNSLPTLEANFGLDGGETTVADADDIDDNIRSTAIGIFEGGTAATGSGYKDDYNSTVNVTYADFGTVVAADRNMKKITVTISNSDGAVVILSTYSANIGEVDYYKRSYQ